MNGKAVRNSSQAGKNKEDDREAKGARQAGKIMLAGSKAWRQGGKKQVGRQTQECKARLGKAIQKQTGVRQKQGGKQMQAGRQNAKLGRQNRIRQKEAGKITYRQTHAGKETQMAAGRQKQMGRQARR